ncbi:MAG: VCBS repeat-containing protein [Planctomycetaceae bacterium]|nr:VCBS repeat-containing protein [Planctomycetaceae bacterium]
MNVRNGIFNVGLGFAFFSFAFLGCNGSTEPVKKSDTPPKVVDKVALSPEQVSIQGITDSETLIQSLSAKKSMLGRSLINSDIDTSAFVVEAVQCLGLKDLDFQDLLKASAAEVTEPPLIGQGLASEVLWPISEKQQSLSLREIWRPLLRQDEFENAQFGVLSGAVLPNGDFEMATKFEGRIRTADGSLLGVIGYQTLVWHRSDADDWKIAEWKQEKLKVINSISPLFEDVTSEAITDPETFKKLSTASHEQLIIQRCDELEESVRLADASGGQSQKQKEEMVANFAARPDFKGCNDWTSVGQYPAVSSVDFNQDGFDDLFVTDRWQPPQMLRSNGDGTFTDVTSEVGLEIDEMVTCGYFFDYDNDGDADLILGLSLVPSLFYENDGGKFIPHAEINEVLKDARCVNAISVADINRDGLLDLYLSTYATGTGPIEDWIGFITTEKEQLKTRLKIERADKFVDRGGPPNILLMNRGGKFEWSKISDELKQYRGSYQSSWVDYDSDGDPDLYVCNDFAPDVFLRNDTAQGSFKPEFVDVTQDIIPTMDMGFGMGCSWGDFNNDGDLDLYVSNMYSKAGNRIVDQIEGSDPRLKVSAHGNFLFENEGGKFRQIAGPGEGQQHVARVGWSFGGQFADFDNDGELDLYVPSGCYSAPAEVKTKIDL